MKRREENTRKGKSKREEEKHFSLIFTFTFYIHTHTHIEYNFFLLKEMKSNALIKVIIVLKINT